MLSVGQAPSTLPIPVNKKGTLKEKVDSEITHIKMNSTRIAAGTIKLGDSIGKLSKIASESEGIKTTKTKYELISKKIKKFRIGEKVTHGVLGVSELSLALREALVEDRNDDTSGWRYALYVLSTVWGVAVLGSYLIYRRISKMKKVVEQLEELTLEEVQEVRNLIQFLKSVQEKNSTNIIATHKALSPKIRAALSPGIYKEEIKIEKKENNESTESDDEDEDNPDFEGLVSYFNKDDPIVAELKAANVNLRRRATSSLSIPRKISRQQSSHNKSTSAPPTLRENKDSRSGQRMSQVFDLEDSEADYSRDPEIEIESAAGSARGSATVSARHSGVEMFDLTQDFGPPSPSNARRSSQVSTTIVRQQ